MEKLPELALANLCMFLSAKDVSSCCATSRGWRDAFNRDSAWRPFCNRLLAAHLKVTECRVEPRFESPEPENSPLSPICKWRLSYMREVHLWNNWRNGRSIKETLGPNCTHRYSPFIQFINSNQVLMKLSDERCVMLWDVKETCVHLYNPVVLKYDMCIDFCEVIEDKIIFLQNDTIQIFKMNDSATVTWEPLGSYNLSLVVSRAFVQSNFLVVFDDTLKLEIFDLIQCMTVKITEIPIDPVHLTFVMEGEKGSMYFTVLLECQRSEEENVVYISLTYSLEQLHFTNSHILNTNIAEFRGISNYRVFGEFLAIFYESYISIYKYSTSELVLDVPIQYNRFKQLDFPTHLNSRSTLYCMEFRMNETDSGNSPVLLIEEGNGLSLSPIASHCLGYKPYNINRLIEHIREHSAVPKNVVGVLFVLPSTAINDIYTKCIYSNELCVMTFW